MRDLSVQLRVTSIRSRGKFGGAIFAGVTEGGESYVAACDFKLLPDPTLVQKGQIWVVSGGSSIRETRAANGFTLKETQIRAVSAQLLRPAGRNIISWIADCADCPGIGQVKATKLYDRFGPELVDLIEQKNIEVLSELLSPELADLVCHAFDKHNVANTLLWLDQMGLQRRIGASVVAYYKDQAQAKIEANPYVLISFEANWKAVDELARKRFSIKKDDPRRMESAIEESLYRGLKDGHTCLPLTKIREHLYRLLGTSELTKLALSLGSSTQYQKLDGYYQAQGLFLIESYVADRLRDMVAGVDGQGQRGLFTQTGVGLGQLGAVIARYERGHEIELNQEQRSAIATSAGANLSLILGGAGTGKTTVLKALYEALEALQPGVAIYQLALMGRAAQRMTEATGRPAMTIASFLLNTEPSQIELGSVFVVDESSMIDVILMYRLLRHLPSGVRLILVGDPAQLPPIGPGLVLHALAGMSSIPQVELKEVKRQSALSGIPTVAAAIRAHQEPVWAKYEGQPHAGVSFVPCPAEQLTETVQQIYADLGGDGSDISVQILAITNGREGGVKGLNTALHMRHLAKAEPVHIYDQQYGVVWANTMDGLALKVGSLVIYTENDYELGLRNGSLGKIIRALPVTEPDDLCCTCEFEGIQYDLSSKQVLALNHAFAITVHKSQGSQFKSVIVPIRESRLLDHALVYTAVTRGINQVVLVGDEEAAMKAIWAKALATSRHISLPMLLKRDLQSAEGGVKGRGINLPDALSGQVLCRESP